MQGRQIHAWKGNKMIGTILLVVVVAVVFYVIGRKTSPKPEAPETPRFGLAKAEVVAAKFGATPEIARVAELTATVAGMELTVVQEAEELVEAKRTAAERLTRKAAELRAKAAEADGDAMDATARADEVAGLAANFTA
ncbi:MAG: hypothetical protein Q8P49_01460 [Candidatus Liptonbacteria bacterium]|nr:hypothetical protein [Candidatus Liptonbacteria bacterium]